jgi:hypothetical protein
VDNGLRNRTGRDRGSLLLQERSERHQVDRRCRAGRLPRGGPGERERTRSDENRGDAGGAAEQFSGRNLACEESGHPRQRPTFRGGLLAPGVWPARAAPTRNVPPKAICSATATGVCLTADNSAFCSTEWRIIGQNGCVEIHAVVPTAGMAVIGRRRRLALSSIRPGLGRPVLVRDEHVPVRELLEEGGFPTPRAREPLPCPQAPLWWATQAGTTGVLRVGMFARTERSMCRCARTSSYGVNANNCRSETSATLSDFHSSRNCSFVVPVFSM